MQRTLNDVIRGNDGWDWDPMVIGTQGTWHVVVNPHTGKSTHFNNREDAEQFALIEARKFKEKK